MAPELLLAKKQFAGVSKTAWLTLGCADMWKKLASMIAGSILVSSCQTSMYKPIICEPGTALKGGRCQKVPAIQNRTDLTPAPKKKVVTKKSAQPSSLLDQRIRQQVPRQNIYGQPL